MPGMTGWLYVLRSDIGPIKVGTSRRPKDRLLQFQGTSPHRIELIAMTPGSLYLEGRIKRRWRASKMWGEWFAPCPAIEADIITIRDIGRAAFLSEAEAIFDSFSWPDNRDLAELANNETRISIWAHEGMPVEIESTILRNARRKRLEVRPHGRMPAGVTLGLIPIALGGGAAA